MSTRATYNFKSKEKPQFQTNTTVYIHNDGYPSGAASHFYLALIHPIQGGGAETMIRSNAEAEITKSHNVHGDTKYRYDVVGWGPDAELIAYKCHYTDDGQKWVSEYHGILHEFIDNHKSELFVDNYSPFKLVRVGYGKRWLNLETAKRVLGPCADQECDGSIMGHLQVWVKNPQITHESANYQSMLGSYRSLIAEFPELAVPNFDEVYDAAGVA